MAVLMVVAFHSGLPVPGGFVGVDVFFVISGFVITGMLHREWAATGRIRFGHFYLRRFKRLTPALALTVTITVLISTVALSPLGTMQVAAKTARGAMLLIANFVIAGTTGGYFDAPAGTNPLLHTWSLSVEEQFYLAFPALIALGWIIARRRGAWKVAPYLLVGAIAAVSFGLTILTSTGWTLPRASWLLGFYSPFTRAWEFAFGALLALALTRLTMRSRSLALGLGLVGSVMLAASLWTITGATPFPSAWTLLPVTGALLLLLAGSQDANLITRVLASRAMVKIGDWSYSIYLWHWPLIVFATLLWPGNPAAAFLAAALSLVPALASYHWVEQPIRGLNRLSRPRLATIMAVTVVPPLALAAGLWFSASNGFWSQHIRDYQEVISADHAPTARGCLFNGAYAPDAMSKCGWNEGASGRPVYLVGDSNAWQFAEAVIGAGELTDRPVWVSTTSSCPFVDGLDLEMVSTSKFFPGDLRSSVFDHCAGYTTSTLDWLSQASPGVVFVAAFDQYWWDPSIGAAIGDHAPTGNPAEKSALFATGLRSTVETLEKAGHRVVLVQTLPTYRNPTPIWDPKQCTIFTLAGGDCNRQVPLSTIDKVQSDSRSAMDQVAAVTGATVLDLRNSFCDSEECSTSRDGRSLYLDATHITVDASAALAPEFATALKAAG